jgi:hypothetical protein
MRALIFTSKEDSPLCTLLQSKEKEIISPRDNLLFFVLVLKKFSVNFLQKERQ